MSARPTCAEERRVDRHFAGRQGPEDEHAMRAHLAGCDACRARYERHLLFEALAPGDHKEEAARHRLGRGLGLVTRGTTSRKPWIALTSLALAALALLVVRPRTDAAFSGRGGGAYAASAHLFVYHAPDSAPPMRALDSVRAGDGLAFTYEGIGAKRQLMIFGVDEHRHVYWYYPAWTNPSEEPASITIEPAGVHRLPDTVKQSIDGTELVIVGLFTEHPLSVKSVERAIEAAPAGALEPAALFREAEVSVARFAVTP